MTHGHKRKVAKTNYIREADGDSCYGREVRNTSYDSTDRYPLDVQIFSNAYQSGGWLCQDRTAGLRALQRIERPMACGGSVPGALWLLPGTYPGGQNLPQPPDTGFLQRAWYSSVRSGPGKAAKSSRPVPSSKETGVSGQLRPQCCGGCFWDGQDRLRPGPRHGTPTGNRCLCDWRCTAALKPFLIPEGRSRSVLPYASAVCLAEVAEQSLT